jgi:hypothetical protein
VRTTVATKFEARVKRILREFRECRTGWNSVKAYVDIPALELMDVELPGVVEDGMPGRNVQRKLGSTRGSPRRSRTAKAPHISRWAVKLRCACEWGAWGRLSDDGPGQHNLDRSEGPWGRWVTHRMAVHYRARGPAQYGTTNVGHEMHEGRRQTSRRSAHAGSRLKLRGALGKSRLIGQPSSRTGENPLSG